MESVFTKEQRHLIYKDALDNYQNGEKHRIFCICRAIEKSIESKRKFKKIFAKQLSFFIAMQFPELLKYKPKETTVLEFWWKQEDRTTRINVLESCIEQTKP